MHTDKDEPEIGINTIRCGNCEKEFDIFLDPHHAYRCEDLNSKDSEVTSLESLRLIYGQHLMRSL